MHHATHDAVVEKKVSFDFTPTAVMAADYLTKPCPTPKFKACLRQIGMPALVANFNLVHGLDSWMFK